MLREPDATVIIPEEAFNDVYLPHLHNLTRTQIYFGGAGSGKSRFVAQRAVYDLMRGGRNYLICRQVGRTLRGSVFTEVCKVILDWGVSELFTINKTDMLITCHNYHQIIFNGLDDIEKLKSVTPIKGAITDIVVDEATETDKNTIKQLFKRQRGGDEQTPKRLTLLFNPVLRSHWLFKEYFDSIGWADDQTEYWGDGISILRTWYIHNRFLTSSDVDDLVNETDKYYSDVFTYARWGILGHVIFTNWRVEDLSEMRDQFTNRRAGLDFGFSSDPAALSVSHYDRMRKTIYVFDELYETGLTNPELAGRMKDKIGVDYVTCDSAEPKSIQELQNCGISAQGAIKGKDSVNYGIQWLQQQEIVIDKSCINTQNELSTYHWKDDAGGNATRVPVDKNNHLIDSLRYAYENEMDGGWIAVGRNY